MNHSEALNLVLGFAARNLPDAVDVAFGDPGMADHARWQGEAQDTVRDLLADHAGVLDALPPPASREWPPSVIQADRSMDPSSPTEAVRVCLADAKAYLESFDADGDSARRSEAVALVEDLLGAHGPLLAAFGTVAPAA